MKSILMIWDIDGTLINPKGTGRSAMNKAFLYAYGIHNAFDDIEMSGRLDAIIVKDAFNKHHIADQDIQLFYDAYCNMLRIIVDKEKIIETLPGVKNILDTKQDYEIIHTLGTGNMKDGARIKLEAQDLNKYFSTGGFGDEGLQRWEIILKAIEEAEKCTQIKFDKDDIYVIGDTPLDIECGKILGIKTIAVATGSHSYEELFQHDPDFIFKTLENTAEFFKIFS